MQPLTEGVFAGTAFTLDENGRWIIEDLFERPIYGQHRRVGSENKWIPRIVAGGGYRAQVFTGRVVRSVHAHGDACLLAKGVPNRKTHAPVQRRCARRSRRNPEGANLLPGTLRCATAAHLLS